MLCLGYLSNISYKNRHCRHEYKFQLISFIVCYFFAVGYMIFDYYLRPWNKLTESKFEPNFYVYARSVFALLARDDFSLLAILIMFKIWACFRVVLRVTLLHTNLGLTWLDMGSVNKHRRMNLTLQVLFVLSNHSYILIKRFIIGIFD